MGGAIWAHALRILRGEEVFFFGCVEFFFLFAILTAVSSSEAIGGAAAASVPCNSGTVVNI